MSQENVQLVRLSIEAGEREDIDTLIAASHPDIEFVALVADVEGRAYHGYDGMRHFADMRDVWVENSYEVEDVIDAGSDQVVAFVRWRATGRVSGVQIDEPVAAVYSFREGRAYRMIVVQSRADALKSVELAE